eukprot:TRINITY_DN10781_c0_g2_i1.p1 TRINITY_DN10781_c0_g2~~TRINITY_DN10781_c0_g2_i1.p1  ORF type:complete len:267 (-),score=21.19 TRINITY_DN10781_c0_g2_i1:148-948(-)
MCIRDRNITVWTIEGSIGLVYNIQMNHAARHSMNTGSPLPCLLPNHRQSNKLAILPKYYKNPSISNEGPHILPQIEEVNSENSHASLYCSNPKPSSFHDDSVKRRLDFSSLTPLKKSAIGHIGKSCVELISPYDHRLRRVNPSRRGLLNKKPTRSGSIRAGKSSLKRARSGNLKRNELKLKELFHVYNIPYQRSSLLLASRECQIAITNSNTHKPKVELNRSKSLPSKSRVKASLVVASKQRDCIAPYRRLREGKEKLYRRKQWIY